MRINKVKLLNIASYKGEHEINFDSPMLRNSGIFLISGNTGAGKSTILDCITLALYAKVYRLGKSVSEIISKGSIKASVELTFTVSGKTYESFIELNIGNKETPRAMRLKDYSGNLIVEGRDDVLDYIRKLCRLDFKQFCQTVILPQGNFEQFLISNPKEKTSIINNIFNLEKYDNLDLYIRKELELTKLTKESLDSDFRNLKNNFLENKRKLEDLEHHLKSLKIDENSKSVKNLKKLFELIDNLIKIKDEFSKLNKSLSSLNLEFLENKEKIFSLTKDYELKLKLNNSLEKELEFYKSEEFLNLKSIINNENENLKEQSFIKNNILSLTKELSTLETLDSLNFNFDYIKELYLRNLNMRKNTFNLSEYNLCLKRTEKLEKENSNLLLIQNKKNSEIRNNSISVIDFDFENYIYYKSLGMFLSFTEELYLNYENKIKELEQSKEKNLEYNIKIKLYYELLDYFFLEKTRIGDERQKLSEIETKYKAYKDKEKLKTKNIDEILELSASMQNLANEILRVKQELTIKEKEKIESNIQNEELERNNKEIINRIGESLFKKYIDYSDSGKIYDFEKKIKEIEVMKNKKKDLNFKFSLKAEESEKNLLLIKEMILKLNLNFEFETYEDFIEKYSNFLNKYMELEERYKALSTLLNELKTKKIEFESKVKFTENEINRLESSKEKENGLLKQSLLKVETFLTDVINDRDLIELFSYNPRLDNFKKEILLKLEFNSKLISEYEVNFRNFNVLKQELEKDKMELKKLQVRLAEIVDRYEKLEIIKKVVSGSTGSPSLKYHVQKFLLQEIINLANDRYLKYIFKDFRLKVNADSKEFDFLVESQMEKYNIRTVKTLSGGEKFLVSLSLSLALSDMVRDSELKIEAFFLDEGFGNLDEHTLKLVISKLAEFQEITGRQIGIISHVAYLKDIIKYQIIISKTPHNSYISLENY